MCTAPWEPHADAGAAVTGGTEPEQDGGGSKDRTFRKIPEMAGTADAARLRRSGRPFRGRFAFVFLCAAFLGCLASIPSPLAEGQGDSELLRLVKERVEAGADLNAVDASGNALLHRILLAKDLSALREIVSAGVNVDRRDSRGAPPLYLAAHWGNLEAVELLVLAGADLRPEGLLQPVNVAAEQHRIEVLEVLLLAGADEGARNASGETPLHWVARNDAPDAIRALLEAGADVEAKDKEGFTPLHHAAVNNAVYAIMALLEADADIEARDNEEATPLDVAVLHNAADAIRTLLDAGAKQQVSCGKSEESPSNQEVILERNAITGSVSLPVSWTEVDQTFREGDDLIVQIYGGRTFLVPNFFTNKLAVVLVSEPSGIIMALDISPNGDAQGVRTASLSWLEKFDDGPWEQTCRAP